MYNRLSHAASSGRGSRPLSAQRKKTPASDKLDSTMEARAVLAAVQAENNSIEKHPGKPTEKSSEKYSETDSKKVGKMSSFELWSLMMLLCLWYWFKMILCT